jgi:hypothetical protein
MKWFIQEKFFTYCHDKFGPVITTHTIQILIGLQIHLCVVLHETRHHAQVRITLGALVDHGLSLAAR